MKVRALKDNMTLVFLTGGFFLGTWFGNGPGLPWILEIGIFSEEYRLWLSRWMVKDAWIYGMRLMMLRSIPLVGLILVRRWRLPWYLGWICWIGFSGAVMMSAALMQKKLLGILFMTAAFFPHGFFYYKVLQYMEKEIRRPCGKYGRNLWFIGVYYLLAVVSESWIHPMIMRWILGII